VGRCTLLGVAARSPEPSAKSVFCLICKRARPRHIFLGQSSTEGRLEADGMRVKGTKPG
jgi:hypothetical protein